MRRNNCGNYSLVELDSQFLMNRYICLIQRNTSLGENRQNQRGEDMAKVKTQKKRRRYHGQVCTFQSLHALKRTIHLHITINIVICNQLNLLTDAIIFYLQLSYITYIQYTYQHTYITNLNMYYTMTIKSELFS